MNITVKNVPQPVYRVMKREAKRNRRSLNAEIIQSARSRLGTQARDVGQFLDRLHADLREAEAERLRLRAKDEELTRERARLATEGKREQQEKVRELEKADSPKAAAVAFMVATSANWRECTRARREDIDPQSGWIHLRGTKRQMRDRRFIVAHPALLSLLRYAAEHAPGEDLQLLCRRPPLLATEPQRRSISLDNKLAGLAHPAETLVKVG